MNPALARIDDAISAFQKQHAGSDVWISAKNLDTGARYGRGENEKVRTASTIKLPIFCAVHQLAAEGKLRFDEPLILREEDKVSGSGVIREFASGTRLTVRDVCHVMIVISDNSATNMIIDRITADYVNAQCDRWGLPATRSMRKVRGDGAQLKAATGHSKAGLLPENQRYGLGSSTAAEMVKLLEMLERGEIVSREASKDIIEVMKRQQYKDGIGRRLDAVMPVASKSGSLDALRSDVGIAYTRAGRMAIAITVDGMPKIDYSPDNPGNILIADLTDHLISALSRR